MRTDNDWIIEFLTAPTLQAATDFLIAMSGTLRAVFPRGTGIAPATARKVAEDLGEDHPALSWGWRLIACRPGEQAEILMAFCQGNELVERLKSSQLANHASARLAVWRDLANTPVSTIGTDLFVMASKKFGNDLLALSQRDRPLAKTPSGIPTLIAVLLAKRWDHAAQIVWRETLARGIVGVEHDRAWLDRLSLDHAAGRNECIAMQIACRSEHPDLLLCWQLLGCDITDRRALSTVLMQVKRHMRGVDTSEYPQLIPRLRVMHDVAGGKYAGQFGSLWHLASTHRDAAGRDPEWTPQFAGAPLALLSAKTLNDAAGDCWHLTTFLLDNVGNSTLDAVQSNDRRRSKKTIRSAIEDLLALKTRDAGHVALAWTMLLCDPTMPSSFHVIVPQLQHMLDDTPMPAVQRDPLQARLDIWWRCADGRLTGTDKSVFELVDHELDLTIVDPSPGFGSVRPKTAAKPTAPQHSVVVIHSSNIDEKMLSSAWKDLIDKRLPRVIASDVAGVRATLRDEYPHAVAVIDSLLRDVRDGKPVRLQSTILLGPAGTGKSRLVRRLAELCGNIHLTRYDCAASLDGMFSGSPRAWSNSSPSVPASAIMSARIANPIVMLDEIEKAGSGAHNGRFWDAVIPFLERETSARYRDTGLNCEIDLSHISYIANANSVEELPSPLRDRFRILRVPAPSLAHLPKLASHVMREIARDDDARAFDEPLAIDELNVIGRAWASERFSMRKLQRIVAATLEVRDQHARRH